MKKQTKRSYLALNYLQNYQTMGNKIENKCKILQRKTPTPFPNLVFYLVFYLVPHCLVILKIV